MKLACIGFVLLGYIPLFAIADSLRAGIVETPPFGIPDKSTGYFVEIINALSKRTNISIEPIFLPFPRIINSLQQRQIDIAILFPNPKLDDSAEKIFPVLKIDNIILSNKSVRVSHLSDLMGKSVGMLRSAPFDDLVLHKYGARTVETNSFRQLLMMLKLERVDAIVGPKPTIEYRMKEQSISYEMLGNSIPIDPLIAWLHAARSIGSEQKNLLRKGAKQIYEASKF